MAVLKLPPGLPPWELASPATLVFQVAKLTGATERLALKSMKFAAVCTGSGVNVVVEVDCSKETFAARGEMIAGPAGTEIEEDVVANIEIGFGSSSHAQVDCAPLAVPPTTTEL